MDDYESLSHTKWDCKYHVVFIPKYRRKALYGELKPYLGEVFRKLALQKESRIEQDHLMPDHIHMMISIPPKYRRSTRSGNTGVHQEPGARGQAPRSTRPMALIAAFRRPNTLGPRQRPQTAALSGPITKAPGFAGGYLPSGAGHPTRCGELLARSVNTYRAA